MHYLKCNRCGHLNVLKTEYQVFCAECDKKLDNSYSNWKLNNPERTFEDFKEVECISDEDIKNAKLQKDSKHKKRGAKFWIILIVTIVISTIVAKGVQLGLSYYLTDVNFDKEMMRTASQINETCPIMVDSDTQLDNAISLPGNIFQYNYTLINFTKEQIDLEDFESKMKPIILNFVKTNPDLEFFREHQTTLKYSYKDKTGVFLLSIAVGPEQYND